MSALDVVLHTSIDPEPFGRVLIEAMALEKPLIGARAGAVPEIVEEGVTGLLFTPGDQNDLTDKVLTMLRGPTFARAMGQRGRERLEERFHINSNVRSTERLYDSILS